MDKLQPVLRHKYWIVFALAMILPSVGWWLDTGSVNAEIEAATAAAEGAFSGVPPASSPNATYAERVKGINGKLAANNSQYNAYLWDTQRQKMNWPARIDNRLRDVAYRDQIDDDVRSMYRRDYTDQLKNLPQYANALSVDNPDGNVRFDLQTFEPQTNPQQAWGVEPPESEEMWDVQEDLWLAQSLLTAVARTNQGYGNILQAPVKEISALILCGGDPKAPKGGAAAAGPEGAAMPEAAAGAPGMPGMPGGGGNAAGFDIPPQGVDFDPSEVFGPDTLQAAGAAGPDDPAAAAPDAAGGAFGAGPMGGQNTKRKRYIDEEAGAPFKTRGFYMHLVMDHSKLPDLMVQLSALDWPVEIVRVQQQITNPDPLNYTSGGMRDRAQPGAAAGSPFGVRRGGGQFPGQTDRIGIRRPRQTIRPRASMDPIGPMGLRDGEKDKEAELDHLAQAALQKKNLVNVAIAGKLTLFQPPAADAAIVDPAADPLNPTAPPVTGDAPLTETPATESPESQAPAGDSADPADPAEATSPGTAPADPAEPEPATPEQSPPEGEAPAASAKADEDEPPQP